MAGTTTMLRHSPDIDFTAETNWFKENPYGMLIHWGPGTES